MADPSNSDSPDQRESRKSPLRWLTDPTPLWGQRFSVPPWIILAVACVAVWRMLSAGDQTSKRWKTLDDAPPSPVYMKLVAPPPQANDVGCPDKPTTLSPPNWTRPNVTVYSVAAPPNPLPTLRDLGDRGQAEAIDFLEMDPALKGKPLSELRDALSDSETAASGEKDPFQFDRVLVATVSKGLGWETGDRMMWTRIFVRPINFSFASYTVAGTDNETIKLTSLETTTTRKFSADIGLTVPGVAGPKASVDPSAEHTVKTTSDVNAQYEKLGVDITPDFLRIIRESETGGDVVGNTIVSVKAVTDAATIRRRSPNDRCHTEAAGDDLALLVTGTHLHGDGAPSDADGSRPPDGNKDPTASVDQKQGADNKPAPPIDILPQVPVPHCALRATVWMLYEWRNVVGGRESYDESKQEVALQRDAEDKMDVNIVSADEVSPNRWSLKICDKSPCDDDKEHPKLLRAGVKQLLQAGVQPDAKDDPVMRSLLFSNYGDAVKVAHWLRKVQSKASDNPNYTFNYPSKTQGSRQSLVPVKQTADECIGPPHWE